MPDKMDAFGTGDSFDIVKHFNNILSKPNPQFTLLRIYGAYEERESFLQRTQFIYDRFKSGYGFVNKIIELPELGFLIDYTYKNTNLFTTASNDRVSSTSFDSQDKALLALLCRKSGIQEGFAETLAKLFIE